jgi:hypothetical protein
MDASRHEAFAAGLIHRQNTPLENRDPQTLGGREDGCRQTGGATANYDEIGSGWGTHARQFTALPDVRK